LGRELLINPLRHRVQSGLDFSVTWPVRDTAVAPHLIYVANATVPRHVRNVISNEHVIGEAELASAALDPQTGSDCVVQY
jgi:hypothetical protein